MKHKHAELIKQWADGAEIEWVGATKYDGTKLWSVVANPTWNESHEYRIKPEPKPDVVEDVFIWKSPVDGYPMMVRHDIPNLRLFFDGESGVFKNARVING